MLGVNNPLFVQCLQNGGCVKLLGAEENPDSVGELVGLLDFHFQYNFIIFTFHNGREYVKSLDWIIITLSIHTGILSITTLQVLKPFPSHSHKLPPYSPRKSSSIRAHRYHATSEFPS